MGGFLKVKLIKLESSHENLRTKEVEGESLGLPLVGTSFVVVGKGIEFGTRLVSTSPVQSVYLIDANDQRDLFHFQTKNSEYALEVYHEPGRQAKKADRG